MPKKFLYEKGYWLNFHESYKFKGANTDAIQPSWVLDNPYWAEFDGSAYPTLPHKKWYAVAYFEYSVSYISTVGSLGMYLMT